MAEAAASRSAKGGAGILRGAASSGCVLGSMDGTLLEAEMEAEVTTGDRQVGRQDLTLPGGLLGEHARLHRWGKRVEQGGDTGLRAGQQLYGAGLDGAVRHDVPAGGHPVVDPPATQ